ncbi:MAG: hypothetical protein JO288_15585 [Hyphomicrobiales bacterium]|nr:hypothetical protein [Hyphomicrobiales bacterium]
MANEPDNIVLALLREIRSKLDEHSTMLSGVDGRIRHLEKQFDDLHVAVTYSLGQSSETQTRQGARIDELFAQLERLIGKDKPQ